MSYEFEMLGCPTGWVCPKCGRVYAPSWPSCDICGKQKTITSVNLDQGIPMIYDSHRIQNTASDGKEAKNDADIGSEEQKG